MRLIPNPEQVAIIDEYGELRRRIQQAKPDVDRAKELSDTIQSWFQGAAPESTHTVTGKQYQISISAKENERKVVNMPKVYRILGKNRFLELVTVALSSIDKFIPEELHPTFLKTARTGKRRLEAVAISQPQTTEARKAA